jgi:soluble P-type ATPase
MIEITIPDYSRLQIEHLVLDYNGTLACDGCLLPGVSSLLDRLNVFLRIHILTADTFGSVRKTFAESRHTVSVLAAGNEAEEKADYVRKLGSKAVVCIGNGRNDRLMLKEAALGIAVLQKEGTSIDALLSADLIIPDIRAALELLLHPQRLIATLRC